MGDKCGRQVGDKFKLMRPKEPRVGDKGETSVNSCGPRNPEWETSLETSVEALWEIRVRQVSTHAAQGTQSGRQGGDKCKLMRPKAPRVGDKFGDKLGGIQSGRQGGDKCKFMLHKEPRVGDKCGRHVWETRGRQV